MTTILDRLAAELDTGPLDLTLSTQVGLLDDVAGLVAGMVDTPPSAVDDFAARLAALSAPALPDGGEATTALAALQAELPTDASAATAGALAEIARFSTLIGTELEPLLRGAVEVARSVESLVQAEFRCPPDAAASAAHPDSETGSRGAGRLAAAQDIAERVDTVLTALPTPITAAALIEQVLGRATSVRQDFLGSVTIPLLDDVTQPLQTLVQWSEMTEQQLQDHLRESLLLLRDRLRAAGAERIDTAVAAAAALQTPMRAPDLTGFGTAYVEAASAMQTALAASDSTAAALHAADLDVAIAEFETVRAAMATDFTAAVPGAVAALTQAPDRMLGALLHLVTQLEPVDPRAALLGVGMPTTAPPEAAAEIQATLAPMLDFLEDLVEKLDFSAIEGGVAAVAAQAQTLADAVNAALADVLRDLRAAFARVETAVARIDLEALASEVRSGIVAAGEALRDAISGGVAPLRDGLAGAVDALSDAVDALDFSAIQTALDDVVASVADILQDPAVVSAVADVRTLLDDVSSTLRQLSFAPVTDEVVTLIEAMTQGLRSATQTDLNDALKAALTAAMAVLPPDLTSVTEPVSDEFSALIEDGPVAMLEPIRSQPQEVLDRIRAVDPAAVVGQALSGPFETATAKLDTFQPSLLIGPLRDELAAQKPRLKASAKPSVVLRPLTRTFDDLLAQVDRLSPAPLLAPIEEAIEQAIRSTIDASPADEILAEIDGVFATVQGVIDLAGALGGTLGRLAGALAPLTDHEAQIDTWRDAILGQLDALPSGAAVTAALTEVRQAVDATRHEELLARFDDAVAPLLTALAPTAPQERLAQMTRLHQQLRPLVLAQAEGAQRAAMQAALDRFDPLDPEHTGGLRAAAELEQGLGSARAALVALGPELTGIMHGAEGALTALTDVGDASALRSLVADEIEPALGPVRQLMAWLAAAAVPIGGFAQSFTDLQTRLGAAVGNIVTGPASLQSIAAAVQSVVDTLRSLDLGVLRDSLHHVFRTVRGQIESLGPRPMLTELDREFEAMIDTLDLDLLLPEGDIAALDATYETVVGQFRALDPQQLASSAVAAAFEETIVPLAEALDLTPVFDALTAALRDLDAELTRELDRVNAAYLDLLAARPTGSGAALGVGV